MPVYTSITAGALIKQLADRVGDLVATGTASSGSTTTIVDTAALSGMAKFNTTDDPDLVDALAYIYAGTNAGAQRRCSALVLATISATLSVAYASAIDNTSKYAFIKRWDGDQYLSSLIQAQRMITWEKRLGMGVFQETGPLRHIQLGNALQNPLFDLFSTANVPDSWTTTNLTVTQSTAVTYEGCRRSLKVVTDGANVANLTQTLSEVGRYPSSFEVTAWVWYEGATGELFIRVNDGVDDHDSTTKHGGTGWEKLKVTVTPSAVAGAGTDTMTVAIRSTTAGSTLTFYVQNVWFPQAPSDDHSYALDADIGLIVLDPLIKVSKGPLGDSVNRDAGTFIPTLKSDGWEVVRETVRRVRLHIGSELNGHVIELTGWKPFTTLSAVSTTWGGSIDAILDMAEAILHKQKVAPQQTPSIRNAASPEMEGDLETVRLRVISKYGERLVPGWKAVEGVV